MNDDLEAVLNSDDDDDYSDLSDGNLEYYAQNLYIFLCTGSDHKLWFTNLMEKRICFFSIFR